MPSRMRRASARTISAKLDAARSLIPASLEIPADNRPSRIAAASRDASTPSLPPNANWASASERAPLIFESAVLSLRLINVSSIILAMKIVHVTRDAKARPIITALTITSADRNIDQGDSSRRPPVDVGLNNLLSPSAGAAAASDVADAATPGTAAGGVAWTGAAGDGAPTTC